MALTYKAKMRTDRQTELGPNGVILTSIQNESIHKQSISDSDNQVFKTVDTTAVRGIFLNIPSLTAVILRNSLWMHILSK